MKQAKAKRHHRPGVARAIGTNALIATLALALPLGQTLNAFAQDASRGPDAIHRTTDLRPENRNGDYLKSPDPRVVRDNSLTPATSTTGEYNPMIFEKPVASELIQRYDSFNKGYEADQHYQLNGYDDQIRYQQANKDLADWAMKRLIQYHLETTVSQKVESSARRAAKSAKTSEEKTAATAVVTMTQVHKALRNTTFNLSENTKTRFRYDLPSGTMSLAMTSPVLNATMDYKSRGSAQQVGTTNAGDDKVSLGVTRKFDFIKASTQARYGLMSETLNYGVNKHLVGPLSAQVDQSHSLRDPAKDETLFRLNFGTNF